MTEQIPITTLRPILRMLSDEQIQAIHHTSLDILSQTGIVMKNETARQLLLDAGAWESKGPSTGLPASRGAGQRRIKIPPHLVMDAIASAPSRIPMHNRLGELTMPLGAGKVFFGPGSDCIFAIDVETGERRKATAEDIRRIAHLCDGLDQMDFIMSMGNPSDVPALDIYIHEFVSMMRGSVKPNVYTANNREDMEDIDVRFIMGGVEVSERTLAREAIHRARPGGGFLADDHTLDNWKWAQWRPALIDRMRHDRWVKKGRKDMTTRATERAREILAEHEVLPLPEEAEGVIAEVIKKRASQRET